MFYLGSRTQINLNTAYIDANFIYGSDKKLAESLRLLQKGQLKTFDAFPDLGLKPILPPKTKQPDDGCLRPHPDIYCFLAGKLILFKFNMKYNSGNMK